MNIGAHLPLKGNNFTDVIARAQNEQFSAVQVFLQSPRAWKQFPLSESDRGVFQVAHREGILKTSAAHASYLINLSTTGEPLKKSIAFMRDELKKASELGIQYYVIHPGSGLLQNAKQALNEICQNPIVGQPIILIENTVGSGQLTASRFEELAFLIEDTSMQICLDTCHAFNAGYPIHKDARGVIAELDKIVGLDNVPIIHFNDSKDPFFSRRDRHENLGEGTMLDALGDILKHPKLANKCFIMETSSLHRQQDLEAIYRWLQQSKNTKKN